MGGHSVPSVSGRGSLVAAPGSHILKGIIMATLHGLVLRGIGLEYEGEEDLVDMIAKDLNEGYPGVDGIKATVHKATIVNEDIVIDVTLDPQDYFTQAHAVGDDDLGTLQALKAAGLPKDEMAKLLAWIKTEPNLPVAYITTEDGHFKVDNFNSKPRI